MSMAGRQLAPGEYHFEDLAEDDRFDAGSIVVTESHIVEFAGLSGDFFALHMDDEFAREQGFPARVAHGLLVLSLADGLKNRSAVRLLAVASLGWRWDFKAPVYAGDRISVAVRVAGKRLSSKGKPLATLAFSVTKQEGILVQSGETTLILQSRRAAHTAGAADG